MVRPRAGRRSAADRAFDAASLTVLTAVLLSVLYPLYFVVIASFSDPNLVNSGNVILLPKGLNVDGYARVFRDPSIWIGYRNSLLYTALGTLINVVLTLSGAYALSRKDFYGRTVFMMLVTFTMFFNGGLIPTYLLVRSLGMLNTIWSMVIPVAVGVWNLIITRTYFQTTIPVELLDAAQIDGCSDIGFFVRVVLPLSNAITAVLVVFYGVGHWNAFFNALIYLRRADLHPLQIILRNILIMNEMAAQMISDADSVAEVQRLAEVVKYAIIIVASIPVLILYPLMQRHFVKGVMIGSIKG